MKRIRVKGPVLFNHKGKVLRFLPDKVYEVADDVAGCAFMRECVSFVEDVQKAPTTRKKTVKQQETEK